MENLDKKKRAAKARDCLVQYEDLLKLVISEEKRVQFEDTKVGTSEFEIVRHTLYNKGKLEGMKHMISKLYEWAKE